MSTWMLYPPRRMTREKQVAHEVVLVRISIPGSSSSATSRECIDQTGRGEREEGEREYLVHTLIDIIFGEMTKVEREATKKTDVGEDRERGLFSKTCCLEKGSKGSSSPGGFRVNSQPASQPTLIATRWSDEEEKNAAAVDALTSRSTRRRRRRRRRWWCWRRSSPIGLESPVPVYGSAPLARRVQAPDQVGARVFRWKPTSSWTR